MPGDQDEYDGALEAIMGIPQWAAKSANTFSYQFIMANKDQQRQEREREEHKLRQQEYRDMFKKDF